MKNPIILLSGGTGVGTSTLSFELANLLNIHNTVSTDFIREVIRSVIDPCINPTLTKSTYTAGQTEHYTQKGTKLQKAEILRAYKTQCRAVQRGVEGVLARAIHENLPLIIEGVHLIPGKLELSPVYQQEKENITQYLVHIRNPKVHQERFKQRQHDAPRRKREQYLANFREIRWIHDYLLRKAAHCQRVHVIDNSGSVRESIDTMVRAHYTEKTLV